MSLTRWCSIASGTLPALHSLRRRVPVARILSGNFYERRQLSAIAFLIFLLTAESLIAEVAGDHFTDGLGGRRSAAEVTSTQPYSFGIGPCAPIRPSTGSRYPQDPPPPIIQSEPSRSNVPGFPSGPKSEKQSPCPETCSEELAPVKCTATLWIDDMGFKSTATSGNQCQARMALCKEATRQGFKVSDVREIGDLSCTSEPDFKKR